MLSIGSVGSIASAFSVASAASAGSAFSAGSAGSVMSYRSRGHILGEEGHPMAARLAAGALAATALALLWTSR